VEATVSSQLKKPLLFISRYFIPEVIEEEDKIGTEYLKNGLGDSAICS